MISGLIIRTIVSIVKQFIHVGKYCLFQAGRPIFTNPKFYKVPVIAKSKRDESEAGKKEAGKSGDNVEVTTPEGGDAEAVAETVAKTVDETGAGIVKEYGPTYTVLQRYDPWKWTGPKAQKIIDEEFGGVQPTSIAELPKSWQWWIRAEMNRLADEEIAAQKKAEEEAEREAAEAAKAAAEAAEKEAAEAAEREAAKLLEKSVNDTPVDIIEPAHLSTLKIGFSEPATAIMEGIVLTHNYICFYLLLILIVVLYWLYWIFYRFHYLIYFPYRPHHVKTFRTIGLWFRKYTHNAVIEVIWTVIPGIILLLIAIPSFVLLYSMEECFSPQMTFKAIGHQWYWSYEYYFIKDNDGFNVSFDSYLVVEADLEKGQHRLLQVDKPILLPADIQIRVVVTGSDVIHSWAVPSFGIKVDAIPGRLNQAIFLIKRSGVFYGQCSELCGVGHGFMPIQVIVA